MPGWREVVLETFCMYNSMSKKVWVGYQCKKELETKKNPLGVDNKHPVRTKNKMYTPASKRPVWCRKQNKKFVPGFRCLCDGDMDKRCAFLAYCNADEKVYKQMRKIKW